MATIPSLSSAFQNLLKPITSAFSTPAIPKTSNYLSVGVSSPAALAANKTAAAGGGSYIPNNASGYGGMSVASKVTPAVPAISSYNANYPNSGANASYVNPANATASKGTVPYIPAGVSGGGQSLVPTSTSAKTGQPASSVPGAVNPSGGTKYTPPPAPVLPSKSTGGGTAAPVSTTSSTAPSFDTASFSSPAVPSFATGGINSGATGAGSFYSPSASTFTGGNGSLPFGYDAFVSANPGIFPNPNDTSTSTGTDLFSSPEQKAAEKAYADSLTMTPEEEAATKRLGQLNSSAATAYVNTNNQAIPLPFITGQQRVLQESKAALAQPLESEIALLQAKRQLAGTASKTALDQANARLAALRDFSKPVGVSYGTNLVNPLTGATVAQGGSLADKNALDTFFNLQQSYPDAAIAWDPNKSANENLQTAQTAVQGSPTFQSKSTTIRSVQLPGGGLGFYNSKDGNIYDQTGNIIGNIGSAANPTIGYTSSQGASLKSDAASLTKQQEYADSTQRAFNTANANLSQLVGYMNSAGINTGSSVPLINELTNKVKAGLLAPGTIAAYQAALAGLRAEYAQVLSRGGEVTEGQRAQANSLIPDNLTPAQLQQVTQRLQIEGANAIKEAQAQVTAIQQRMSSAPSNFGVPSGSSGGAPAGWSW